MNLHSMLKYLQKSVSLDFDLQWLPPCTQFFFTNMLSHVRTYLGVGEGWCVIISVSNWMEEICISDGYYGLLLGYLLLSSYEPFVNQTEKIDHFSIHHDYRSNCLGSGYPQVVWVQGIDRHCRDSLVLSLCECDITRVRMNHVRPGYSQEYSMNVKVGRCTPTWGTC
jgi:hypothetical protein